MGGMERDRFEKQIIPAQIAEVKNFLVNVSVKNIKGFE